MIAITSHETTQIISRETKGCWTALLSSGLAMAPWGRSNSYATNDRRSPSRPAHGRQR
jgi:hypothetical protein